jgi:hypothetical protein
MFFALITSIFGFMIVIRMLKRLNEHHWFEESELTKIGTVYFAAVFVLLIALPRSHLTVWIAVFVPIAVVAIAVFSFVGKRSARFRIVVRESLTQISLKMKSGHSFRQSLVEISEGCELKFRPKLCEITRAVVFSQHKSPITANAFIMEVVDELIRIDRNSHAASKRLSVYREKLRLEDDFRRRSGQVLARIRAQSIVMSGLYLALFAFMIARFGWKSNATALILSAILFGAGGAWLWVGGRRMKWRV